MTSLRSHHRVLRNWKFIPTKSNREPLRNSCGKLGIAIRFAGHQRKPADLAKDLEIRLLEEAADLLGYGTEAWKTALAACVAWVKQHRDADDNKALTSILALSDEVLSKSSQYIPMSTLKPAMQAELIALRTSKEVISDRLQA